ncbi:NAD-dependent succinate-semialdehyde dehydrogenase [Scopulibacillus cellulosilyticus]|uniref:NAD-dependent succinate-semialdehyde dehydrogenase n=1 Tax=Scopulibacillus cellulosilyticus TaxID=2665665 RepID=A0ABW2PTG9_9BACL
MDKLNYINGEWVGKNEQKFEIKNPATGEVVGTMPEGTKQDVESAIDAADKAFPEWANLSAEKRADYLKKLFHIMMDKKEELATIMTLESGKPLKEARGEVDYAASFIEWFAEEARRAYGRIIPGKTADQRIQVIKQPVGVVAAITPWNFPAAMITRKMGPALAAGCTFIVKPPKETPLTAIKLMEYCEEAGIPKGVVNHVVCPDEIFSNTIKDSTKVRKLTFTGSTEVGVLLMKQSAEHIKKVSFELGGQAPFIVLDDADLDKAVKGTIASKFRNAGQTCICANRFYVQSKVYDAFIEKLEKEVKKLKVGNGLEEGVDIGPLINKDGYEKVEHHVKDALEKGAKVVTGGKGEIKNDNAYFFEPTILKDCNEHMVCMQQETFGPLIPVQKIETDEEAIGAANHTRYGLAGYFFTESVTRGTKMAEALQYGIVGWNHGAPSAAQAPFGGMKESGLGREGGTEGFDEYLETKYISFGL